MREREVVIEVYRSGAKKNWFWRAVAHNNRIIADGGEGYENLNDLLTALVLLFSLDDLEAFKAVESQYPFAYAGYRREGDTNVEVVRIEIQRDYPEDNKSL